VHGSCQMICGSCHRSFVDAVVCKVYSFRSTTAITIQKRESMASWISARVILSPGKELQIFL